MEINSRAAQILDFLLGQANPVSAEEIGRQLKLTPRAVRYRMPQIAALLNEFTVEVINKPRIGIQIIAGEQVKSLIKSKINLSTYYSKSEREYIILFLLLSASTPVIIKQIEYLLSVARSTISKDIKNLKEWVKDYGLVISSKPNYGFWMEGDESDFREALLSCVLTGAKAFGFQDEFLCYCFADYQIYLPPNEFSRQVSEYFSNIDFLFINQLLNTIIDIQLTDRTQFHFILRLAIMLKRLSSGNLISAIPKGLGDLKQLHEYYWSEFIFRKISEKYQIPGGLEEISWITEFLIDAQANRPVESIKEGLDQNALFKEDLVRMVNTFLCRVSRRLNPALAIDKELRYNLALHLSYYKEREDLQRLDDNPVIQEIRVEYPRIFSIVHESIREDNETDIKLNDDEIAYLTIHIAAAIERLRYNERSRKTILIVCNAGMASALLLKSKILSEFPETHIDNVISYSELLKRSDFQGIDMIISTIPLHLVNAPPVLVVNVILKERDIANLQKVLLVQKREGARYPNASIAEGPRLAALLDNNLISIREIAEDWEEATDKAGNLLLKSHLIDISYIESMKNVVKEFGPYIVAWPGVALLHANCDSGAKQPGISLITLENPVNFGHPENDPVDIVIALSLPRDHSLALALDQLNNLLMNQDAVKQLRGCYRRSTVMMLIKKFSQESAFQTD
ncbi:MAG TPA: PTS sugar transporter subunit IIA [Pelolinea sp.]|nr:PTS sugar transporter subunit IIA [Pelolinea sp.]